MIPFPFESHPVDYLQIQAEVCWSSSSVKRIVNQSKLFFYVHSLVTKLVAQAPIKTASSSNLGRVSSLVSLLTDLPAFIGVSCIFEKILIYNSQVNRI